MADGRLTGSDRKPFTGSEPAGAVINGTSGSEFPGSAGAQAPLPRRPRGRRVVFILWLVLLAQGIIFALIQPVWSRVDEAQHFDYVENLVENRSLPVEGQTFVSPRVVAVSLAENQWGWAPAGALSTPAYLNPSQWQQVPKGLSGSQRNKWVKANLWHFNYEAMQPPLYYAINAPVYAALPDNSLIKLYGMRLLAALLASAMVPITYLVAREAFPDSRLVTYGAPVAVLLTQGYALNMSQVSNDALAVPLAAAAILVLLRMVGRGLTVRWSLLAGALVGASMLSKLTTVFLVPVALTVPLLLLVYRREKLKRALLSTAIVLGVAAAIMVPWLAHNFSVYGDATGAGAAQPLMSSFFWSPMINTDTLRLSELLPTYWFGEPIFPFPFWTWAWAMVAPAMAVGAAGLLYYFLGQERKQVRDVQIRVLFLVLAFVTGVVVNLLIPFASGIGGVPGRYLYAVMPAGAFLLLFGIDRLLRRERALFFAELLLCWMVLWESLNFLAYVKNL